MAESLVILAMKEISKKLGSTAIDGISRACGLEKELTKLNESARMIQAVLQDAEEKQAIKERVKLWLPKLQEVVDSAEDVLDDLSYENLRQEVEIQGRLKHKVFDFLSPNNFILFRLKMADEVKKINESLSDIENQARGEHAIRGVVAASHGVAVDSQPDRAKTDSRLDKSETPIGRESEVKAIIDMLEIGSSKPPFLNVISIVGFGGLGKTTLAKLVLEKAQEKKLFDKTMWVCVSENFDDERILGEMLQNLDKSTGGLSNIDAIIRHLRKQLRNDRFLLVLDDVWNDDFAKWDSLKIRLQKICERDFNFVIVTARSSKVAGVMGTATEHLVNLKQLPDYACLSIIKNKWSEKWGDGEPMPKELETMAAEIAEKMGGVPLTAQVLGRTLCSNKDKEFWLSIKDNNAWKAIGKDRIFSVLKLSFDHLRPPVKRCFAYCSLFPKDFVLEKEVLIQLWMAEEFLNATSTIRGTNTRSSMEDIGEEYFNSLIADSFFQNVQVDAWGNIFACKMHDLLHDLALFVSNAEMLRVESGYIFKTSDGRRLNFACNEVSRVQEVPELTTDRAEKLRSVFSKVDVSPILPNFNKMRSLDMSDAKLEELPSAIEKLKHLRYLDISRNESIQALPESITKLYNLQTLRLLGCNSLKALPSNIRNLVSLRHIRFDDKSLMPSNVGCLTSLRTLPLFVVGVEEGHKIYELEGLNELRGELVIYNLEHVRDGEEAKRAKLEKKKLSGLVLIWKEVEENNREDYSSSSSRECNHEDVLRSLQPSRSILRLTIACYMGKNFPQWLSQLNKLVRLELTHCKKCETMPTLGHLDNLKVLVVEEMDNIKFMGSEFYGEISNNRATLFRALEEFSIKKMKSLVEWRSPGGAEAFPKLRDLCIEDCPCLTSIPLSHWTSSVIGMEIEKFYSGENLVDFWCFQEEKSLKNLYIDRCPKFTSLPISLTSLQLLEINDRPIGGYVLRKRLPFLKVMRIVGVVEIVEEFPKSLENLVITNFENLSADAFRGLSSLKHLEILNWSLQSIPTSDTCDLSPDFFPALTCLEELYISKCHKLRSLPAEIKLCRSLKSLTVADCEGLTTIADDMISSLTQLKKLELGSFSEELEEMPGLNSIHPLSNPSLETVKIVGKEQLKSLPHQLQHLPSIRELEIYSFRGVETLPDWLGNLSSLQRLSINGFRDLKYLPRTMKGLSKLTSLNIWDCRSLKTGPEWDKISHIPFIKRDGKVIQDLNPSTNPHISTYR